MRVLTRKLARPALNWAVAQADKLEHTNIIGKTIRYYPSWAGDGIWRHYDPAQDWAQGGPISEREGISSAKKHDGWWVACIYDINDEPHHHMLSHNRLEAEMRCYVASKLGDEVEVPEELL